MADTTQFANQAQDVTRSVYGAFQGVAETQLNILQKLSGVTANQFNQAVEAANDQMQLIGRVKNPHEFAAAQADLIKAHGQRYVDTVKSSVDIMAEAWQQYGDRLEKGAQSVNDSARQATSSRKS